MSRLTQPALIRAVPEEALRLNEDVTALRQAAKLLATVDRYNVDDDHDSDRLFFTIQRVKEFERYARRKLAIEYLDPRRKKLNER
jgi:hypothetical protein